MRILPKRSNRQKALRGSGSTAEVPEAQEGLLSRVRAHSGRLAWLEAENRRLTVTNMDQRTVIRNLRDEIRTLKIEKHNDFLNWLCEPENYLLIKRESPVLLARLHEALDSGIPEKPKARFRTSWED